MYLVVDLEATCDENHQIPREEMEIIEIGAVMLDEHYKEVDRFTTFVRPTVHPVLTPYCFKLTTIRQSQVDKAPGFAEATARFANWFSSYKPLLWSSWGYYDARQFEQDCQRHRVTNPLANLRHVNVKEEYQRVTGRRAGGLGRVTRDLGLGFEGTHHRGVDDAANIGRVVARLFGEVS